MSDYEITYLSNPQIAEEERGQLDAAIDGKVADLGGSISFNSPHTRRCLAYPVAKTTAAFLRMIQTELPGDQIDSLRQFLKKQAGVLRFTILNTPRRQEVPVDIMQEKVARQPVKAAAKPAKAVTMADVEKGIEEALTEEVK